MMIIVIYAKKRQGVKEMETRRGFTLIELSLSIAFISVLSLAVVLIITNSVAAYHRGLVLNQINTNGMELVDDIRASVQNSPVELLTNRCNMLFEDSDDARSCENNGAKGLVSVQREAVVKLGGESLNGGNPIPVFGAFCTGSYSYIWNSGYFFNPDVSVEGANKASLKYPNGGEESNFRLLKIQDKNRAICAAYSTTSEVFNVSDGTIYQDVTEDPVELLSENGSLALYDLYVATTTNPSQDNMFYSVSFVLGTLRGGADVSATEDNCKTPEDDSILEDFDYCAINKFNFAAQATGGEL